VSTATDYKRRQIAGRGIPVTGNDIDTDRIIPARFLKAVTFETMGEHAFEDARKQNPEHPFNSLAYKGASVLVVGQNFGCGSSREHAPQALMRWGIRAIVGGSFGEIFFGNCVMLGIPCLRASQEDIEWLQREIGRSPQSLTADIEKQEVRLGERVIKATIPDGARNQLINDTSAGGMSRSDEQAEGTSSRVIRLAAGARLASLDRRAPAGQERRDERVLLRGIDGERRQRERDGERDMVALGSGGDGAPIRGMCLVDPHRRFNQMRELRLLRPRLEGDAESVACRAPVSHASCDVTHGG
jgi:3-isopropylmalate/(R)-2-methylmalate dehydratase small subunit